MNEKDEFYEFVKEESAKLKTLLFLEEMPPHVRQITGAAVIRALCLEVIEYNKLPACFADLLTAALTRYLADTVQAIKQKR